jgi:hypothetical protein
MKTRAFLLLIVCVWLTPASAAAESAIQIVASSSGASDNAVGTAVYVMQESQGTKKEWLLTAYHTIRERPKVRLITREGLAPDDLANYVEGDFYIVPHLGLAAIRVSSSGRERLQNDKVTPAKLVAERQEVDGSLVVAVGNPDVALLNDSSRSFGWHATGSIGKGGEAGIRVPEFVNLPKAKKTYLLFVNDVTITYGFSRSAF